ncbi:hypothetical protein CPAV1605_1332 [seawater metagenome]|uniref:Patatin-like phospholipase n=1 Tax=seawater metagenome TaxID=1561972 RepID=A0A5E8CMI8_9ZZZZ
MRIFFLHNFLKSPSFELSLFIFIIAIQNPNTRNFCLNFFKHRERRKKKEYKKNQKIGLSFGPTGGLFMYSHGIAKFLEENYDLSDVIFAGTSGGCQPSYFLASGISMDDAWDKWALPMMEDMWNDSYSKKLFNFLSPKIKPGFTCLTTGMARSKRYLGKMQKKNNPIYEGNKLYLNILDIVNMKQISIADWRSFDDLFYGVQSTQYIPFLFGFPFSIFRNKWCVDGFFIDTRYEPLEDVFWIHLNPYKWQNRGILHGLLAINNFYDINFHINEREKGYLDAKNNREIFELLPMK